MIDALLENKSQHYEVAHSDLLRLHNIILNRDKRAVVRKRQQELNLAAEIY